MAQSVSDIEGPWKEPDWDSCLIERCRQYWDVSIDRLPDLVVATYLDQGIAVPLVVEEARRRLASGNLDGSELFEGQLAEAFQRRAIAN